MELVYKSLKLKGPKQIFSRANFFSSRIVFNDNRLFDINNDEVKYAIFREKVKDKNNKDAETKNYFYLKQSRLNSLDFTGSLKISGLNTDKISFSGDANVVGSLKIENSALPSKISSLLKTDNKNEYIYTSNDAETEVEFSTFIACDSSETTSFVPGDGITSGSDFMPVNSSTSLNLNSTANLLDLTNTAPIASGYKYSSGSTNLMGYTVNGNVISDEISDEDNTSKIETSKIVYDLNKYTLIVKQGKLTESEFSNILKLTPDSKVYYKEYDSKTNTPGWIANPSGIYIVREIVNKETKFTIYTPALKEE